MYIIHLSVWAPPSANGHDLPMRLTASHTCVLLDFFLFLLIICSAQRVPEPDPLPGISLDTRPDPIQF